MTGRRFGKILLIGRNIIDFFVLATYFAITPIKLKSRECPR